MKFAIRTAVARLFAVRARFLATGCLSAIVLPCILGCPECSNDADCGGCNHCDDFGTIFDRKCISGCRGGFYCDADGGAAECKAIESGACCNFVSQTCNDTTNVNCTGDGESFLGSITCEDILSNCEALPEAGNTDSCPEGPATVPNDCDPVADFSGTWTSAYSCRCGNEVEQDTFELTIMQDGNEASYIDELDLFAGPVCGAVWSFTSDEGIEGGTLELNADGTACRYSETINEDCAGGVETCVDKLTRVP